LIEEVTQYMQRFSHFQGHHSTIQVEWKESDKGSVKCNTDENVIASNHKAVCGGVFGDESCVWY